VSASSTIIVGQDTKTERGEDVKCQY